MGPRVKREDDGVIRYVLDLQSPTLHCYQGLLAESFLGTLPGQDAKEIRRMVSVIIEEAPFSAVVIFGSFAEGKQKRGSDVDVAVFTEHDPGPIERRLRSLQDGQFRTIDCHVITREDFQEMLANGERNLGKEIRAKHRVLVNAAAFYELLLSARNPPARVE